MKYAILMLIFCASAYSAPEINEFIDTDVGSIVEVQVKNHKDGRTYNWSVIDITDGIRTDRENPPKWKMIKCMNDGVIVNTTIAGKYLLMCTDDKGETSKCRITFKGDIAPVPVDLLTKDLRALYKPTDANAVTTLKTLFKEAVKQSANTEITTLSQLLNAVKETASTLFDDPSTILAIRQRIAVELNNQLGSTDAAMDDALRDKVASVFQKIVNALENVK